MQSFYFSFKDKDELFIVRGKCLERIIGVKIMI